MKEPNATMVVMEVARMGNVTSFVPDTMTRNTTRSLAARDSPASVALCSDSNRRWMASRTRMELSRMRPKHTARPLIVMKFTDSPKK